MLDEGVTGADNRPPMLEKSLYDSWKSRMKHYMENRESGRMILSSVQNGPLIWPTVTEADVTTRTKKYEELSATKKIQADCYCTATNIGETLYQYYWRFAQLINNMNVINMSMRAVQVNTKFLNSLPPEWSLAIPVFNQGDDPISCLKKVISFLTVVASLRFPSPNNQLRTSSNPRNQAIIQDDMVTVQQVQGKQGQTYDGNSYKGNATSSGGKNTGGQARVVKCYTFQDPGIPDGQATQTTIPNTTAFQTKDLDAYDFDCDDVSNAKVILMANLSSYGSDVLLEVPHSENSHNDMGNQSVHAM
ncbi:hypothetical protein Tco_0921077 [Tanacetum coccineum]